MVQKLKGLHDVELQQGRLRYIDIYFGGTCNLSCEYCFTNHQKGRLTTADRKSLLEQASKLGVKTFVCTGAGEPMMDEGFREVIQYANSLGMTSVIYTNGNYITPEMAKFLYENNVSPLIKLESLDPETHDQITNVKGSHQRAVAGIESLLSAGYGANENRVARAGIAAVYTALNIGSFSELKDYCDRIGFLFTADELGLEKKARENQERLFVGKDKVDEVKKRLGIIESGIGHANYGETTTCRFADYGLRIDQEGNVSYCTMQDIGRVVGNVLEEGLDRVVYGVRIAKEIAIREKLKTLGQVNETLLRNGYSIKVRLPSNTCPFKGGDNLVVEDRK